MVDSGGSGSPETPRSARRKRKVKPPEHVRSQNLNVKMSPVEIDAFYVLALVRDMKASVLARRLILREVKREARRRSRVTR